MPRPAFVGNSIERKTAAENYCLNRGQNRILVWRCEFNDEPKVKPTDLRGILQYIPQFREKTFILAIDGAIVTDENFATLLLDVAVLRSLNIRVVLVHGASAQIKALADEQKMSASNLDGSGITDAATLQIALTAANRLTHEILEGLSANDLRAASTNVIIAHPMGIIQGVNSSTFW